LALCCLDAIKHCACETVFSVAPYDRTICNNNQELITIFID
jgi:hypothetical protein